MKKQYVVARLERVVYVDPKFVEKAGQLDTEESILYDRLMEKYPSFKFEEKKLNESSKNTYKGLNYDVMKAFIKFYEEGENQQKMLDEFDNVLAESVFKKAPPIYVRSWFLSKYKEPYNKSSFAQQNESKKEQAIRGMLNPASENQKGVVSNG